MYVFLCNYVLYIIYIYLLVNATNGHHEQQNWDAPQAIADLGLPWSRHLRAASVAAQAWAWAKGAKVPGISGCKKSTDGLYNYHSN